MADLNGSSPERARAVRGDGARASVCGVLAHDRNRELLADWLGAAYDVRTPDPGDAEFRSAVESGDLVVVDAGAYRRHGDRIDDLRSGEDALFRPVLLLVAGDDARGLPDVWETVDDVVAMPVEKAALHARIRGLLDRRALSREVAASEARFRALFETSPDPAVVLDDCGFVADTNTAFAALVDVPTAECRGRPLSAFDAFDEPAADAMTALATADGGGTELVTYTTADGGTGYAECASSDLATGDDTAPEGAAQHLLILRDVSERVRNRQDLERQVERLDEFAGVLAHEMRNPLSIASGWLERARETGDADAFDRVEGAHERMRVMIDDLLALARQGRLVGEHGPVALAPLVADAWESVVTGDATLHVDPGLSECRVSGDRDRLEEVFANLFRNAVEHGSPPGRSGPRGEGADRNSTAPGSRTDGDGASTVTVEVVVHEDGGGLSVVDDGPGLTDVDVDRLFEPGYTTADEGTGFGLAIVEQVVDAHGWTVTASEAPDGGASFDLRWARGTADE